MCISTVTSAPARDSWGPARGSLATAVSASAAASTTGSATASATGSATACATACATGSATAFTTGSATASATGSATASATGSDSADAKEAVAAFDSVQIDRTPPALSRFVSVTAGTVGGMVGLIANGCAGGAHGLVKGAGLSDTTADIGFQAAFATNLLATGGILYGASSAMTTLFSGLGTWKYQAEATRQQTLQTTEQYLGQALAALPPVPPDAPPTLGRIVGQAALGEAVGLVAGAVVGAQGGYAVGSQIGEKAAAFTSRALYDLDRRVTAFLDHKTAEVQSKPLA